MRRIARSGLLLLDKPEGLTSHDAVMGVRRAFGQREVGHAGTLDPMATGLLVVALGQATRLLRFAEAAEKRYAGTVRLGRATATYDREGATTAEVQVPQLPPEQIHEALAKLTGTLEQPVPAYSAVKVGGERLYAKARRGEVIELPVRTVEIRVLRAVRIALPDVEIETVVSKGTYVRSLAVQIGEALGLPAHLAALRRTGIGAHAVERAIRLDALRGVPEELLPAAAAVEHLAAIHVDEAGLRDVRHGRAIVPARISSAPASLEAGQALRVLGPSGALAAMVFAKPEGGFEYACVLPEEGPAPEIVPDVGVR